MARQYGKDMLICEVVDAHPKAKDVLLSFGLPCFRCIVAYDETLEAGLRPHAIDPDEVLARLEAEAPLPRHEKKSKNGASAGGP